MLHRKRIVSIAVISAFALAIAVLHLSSSVANAVQSDVVAFYANDPGQVSVAFGEVDAVLP